MYTPCSAFRRTPAERADQELSWRRSDQAFFAAGACHILAFAFRHLYPDAGFSIIGLRKVGEAHASHVYVSDGTWAFDHDGWTLEEELLAVTAAAAPDTSWERLVVDTDLDIYCREHLSRPPHLFAHSPWQRAYDYIARHHPPGLPPRDAVHDVRRQR